MRSIKLLLLACLLSVAQAAITLDATSNGGSQTTSTSYTFSHTTASGAVMLCGVVIRGNGAARTVTTLTYNGTTLTQVRRDVTGFRSTEVWRLYTPSTGANTVSFAASGAVQSTAVGCITLLGASTVDVSNGGSFTTTTSTSTSLTTTANNDWIVNVIGGSGSSGLAPTEGSSFFTLSPGDITGGAYYAAGSAGATSVGWTWTGNGSGTITAVAIKASATTALQDIIGLGLIPVAR